MKKNKKITLICLGAVAVLVLLFPFRHSKPKTEPQPVTDRVEIVARSTTAQTHHVRVQTNSEILTPTQSVKEFRVSGAGSVSVE